jgi:hypothetical protein
MVEAWCSSWKTQDNCEGKRTGDCCGPPLCDNASGTCYPSACTYQCENECTEIKTSFGYSTTSAYGRTAGLFVSTDDKLEMTAPAVGNDASISPSSQQPSL